MIELSHADYRLAVEPGRGGSIARFAWRGLALMRETCGAGILDTASFPLVPFSNRIAFGDFDAAGKRVKLSPNMPGSDHPHPLHGFGWLVPWEIVEQSPHHLAISHRHTSGEWPWDYTASQRFELSDAGLHCTLAVTNQSPDAMPAGLGFHPYFPLTARTRYLGLHRGEWTTSAEGLPLWLEEHADAIDWWQGQPVGQRAVDTVYAGRNGTLELIWPERELALTITPSDNLPCTVVYTPAGADFFCVEPVSHATDAINRAGEACAMQWLQPGESMTVSMLCEARRPES